MGTVGEAADAIPVIAGWLAERGQAPAGPPFLRYLVIDMAGDLVVQVGVPTTTAITGDGFVEPDELPAGEYLSTVHVGPYEGIREATARLFDHARGEGLRFDMHATPAGEQWASRLEWYETNPAEDPDPSGWVTRLELKLAD